MIRKRLIIIVGVIVIFAGVGVSVIMVNKYPSNYIYEFDGFDEHLDSIEDIYRYDKHIYAVVRSGKMTSNGLLNNEYRYNLILSKIDSEDTVIDTITFSEIDNNETSIKAISTYRYNELLYLNVMTGDEMYLIIYNCDTNIYEIEEIDLYMYSFIVDSDKLYGYKIIDTPVEGTGNYYHDYLVMYYELNSNLEIQYEEEVLSLLDSEYLPNPVLSNNFLAITGAINDEYNRCDYILYDVTTYQTEVIRDVSCDNREFGSVDSSEFVSIDNVLYRLTYVFNSEEYFDLSIYNLEGTLLNTISNPEEQFMFIDQRTGYMLVYREDSSNYNKVKLQNIFTSEIVEYEFDVRTFLSNVYIFEEEVYLVVGFKESTLDMVANRYNEYYIIHENLTIE